MDLRTLHYFVAIADRGSLTAATRVLHISQPALTTRLHELEEEVGVELLIRKPWGVELTAAGRQFYEDAKKILLDTSALAERTRNAQRGVIGEISLGVAELNTWLPEVRQILGRYKTTNPLVTLRLNPLHSGEQLDALRQHELDGGFLFFRAHDDPTLDGVPVHIDHPVLAVQRNSELAKRKPKKLQDIQEEDFVWFPRHISPAYHDQLMMCFRQAQFKPRILHVCPSNNAMLSLVAAGLGCAIVPGVAARQGPKDVLLIPLEDLNLPLVLEFVWMPDRCSPALWCFIEACRHHAINIDGIISNNFKKINS